MELNVLPHYKVITQSETFDNIKSLLGYHYLDFFRALGDLDKTVGQVVCSFLHIPYLDAVVGDHPQHSISAVMGVTSPLRYLSSGGRTFEIESKLNFLLEETDIGNKAPGAAFVLPFPSIYLHFPKGTRIPIASSDKDYAVLVGVYINEVYDPDFEIESRILLGETGPCRSFEIVFMSQGSPGLPEDSDFVHSRFIIPDSWQDDPIETILKRQMDVYESIGKRSDSGEYSDFYKNMSLLNSHLMKCLLFINSDEAILREVNEARDTEKRIKSVLNKAKKRKLEQQLRRHFDKIIVSHQPLDTDISHTPSGMLIGNHKRRSHWRRGHMRNQAHGPGRKDRKIIWIRPHLITGEAKGEAPAKTYLVK